MLNLPVLRPLISLCIPPALKAEAQAIAAQEPMVHPVWRKLEERGRHFLVRTNDISDIEEVADWARSWLVEPDGRLDKTRRQAFQTMVERAGRHVHLSPLGPCHFIATGWKQKPAPQPYKQR
jgi:hypothetical protein